MNVDEHILTAILNCRRTDLIVNPPQLTSDQQKLFQSMKARYSQGEPLQYIIGYCDFMGSTICVDSRVLIPRPETEILVERTIQRSDCFRNKEKIKILDLGAGSGCIDIALAKALSRAHITAIDRSSAALIVAGENVRLNHVELQVSCVLADMNNFCEEARSKETFYDIIISNPPYIRTADLKGLPADVQQEPQMALDGGEDGLKFYKEIIPLIKPLLADGGFVAFEHGDGQEKYICDLLVQEGFQEIEQVKDYTETNRIIFAS